MKIPKESIPKFLAAFVILIIMILAMTRNTDELSAPDFNFDLEITEEGEMKIPEEENVETTTTTTTSTPTTPATTTSAPATTTYVSSCYPSLSGQKDSKYKGIILSWSRCENDDFQFYKLVKSSLNSNPSYPNDGVAMSSSNRSSTSYIDKTVARATTYYYRVCAVNRLNKVTCGNTVSVTY